MTAETTLRMIYVELIRAQKMLQNGDSLEAHSITLEALHRAYRLVRPHTRRDDTKLPFDEIPKPELHRARWANAGNTTGFVEEALSIQAQMQSGQMGWEMWNELADWILEALKVL